MNESNDPEALRRDRDQARRELGETVAELTDKLDVPARTKDKVTDAKFQALATADQAREKAEQAQLAAKEKTRHAAEKVESSVPQPVAEGGRQVAEVARRQPVPVAAVAAVAAGALVWLIARRRRS
ncbi:DUF3618 domain-containing protein [Nocardia halotolerans]|uniref:DUF3618 domain-containing protein n=1 Tax=Nocardia halotolerans TaxID=1755878 RepID=A0ABV8VGN5_9NOCA